MSPKSFARIALMLLCVAALAFAFLLMAMTGPAFGFYALAALVAIIVGIDQLLGETSGRNDAIERAQRLSARAKARTMLPR